MDNAELILKGVLLMGATYIAEDYFKDKLPKASYWFSATKTLGVVAVIYGAYGLLKK